MDALVTRGDEVVVLDDLSSGRRENLEGAIAAGATLVEADIADADAVGAAFTEHRPELVFHLAAQIDVRRSVKDPAYDLGLNAGGTIHLLEAARTAGTGRFAFASTGGAIYGEVERAKGEVVFARDMELKYVGVFKSSIIYRAARDLVCRKAKKRVLSVQDF